MQKVLGLTLIVAKTQYNHQILFYLFLTQEKDVLIIVSFLFFFKVLSSQKKTWKLLIY